MLLCNAPGFTVGGGGILPEEGPQQPGPGSLGYRMLVVRAYHLAVVGGVSRCSVMDSTGEAIRPEPSKGGASQLVQTGAAAARQQRGARGSITDLGLVATAERMREDQEAEEEVGPPRSDRGGCPPP